MRYNSVRRWVAGLAVTAVFAAAAGASPVQAQAADASIGVYFPSVTVAPDHAGVVQSAVMYGSETLALTDAKITYDLRGVAGVVTLRQESGPGDCVRSSGRLVCEMPYELHVDEWGTSGYFDVAIAAAAGAAAGAEGTLLVTLEADGYKPVTHTARVRVGEGVNLAGGGESAATAQPGESFDAPLTVRNVGTNTVDGVVAVFFNDYEIQSGGTTYANCTYEADELRTCSFDTALEPGQTYSAELTYRLAVDTYAPGIAIGEAILLTPADFEDYADYLAEAGVSFGEPGAGEILALEETGSRSRSSGNQTDVDPYDNWSSLRVKVTGTNGADLSAVGDEGTGAVGDVVPVTVGVKNEGPATISDGRSGEPITAVTVEIPAGATAVEVPELCAPMRGDDQDWENIGKPGERNYWCRTGIFLPVDESETFDFQFRIDEVIPDSSGVVGVNPECQCAIYTSDPNPRNDQAALVLNPTGGTGGGESGDGDGGSLPITGAKSTTLAVAGIVLLMVGVGGFFIARNRRMRFTA